MLTVDDVNNIIEKYGNIGFWYKISKETIMNASKIDFIDVSHDSQYDYIYLTINNAFVTGYYMVKNRTTGEVTQVSISSSYQSDRIWQIYHGNAFFEENDLYLYIWRSGDTQVHVPPQTMRIYPRSSLNIISYNGKISPEKIYIDILSHPSRTKVGSCDLGRGMYNLVSAEILEDDIGYYVEVEITDPSLPYFMIRTEGFANQDFVGRVVTYKELPIFVIPPLYLGTPQTIQIINSDTEEPITEFQAYYQGRLLQDNQITLPYDTDDYVDIVVDLKDPNYPNSTVKLKAPTVIYQADSQSDVETAIEKGIQTLQVGDTQTEVSLNSIELSNVTLINSNIQVSESILTDCQIIDTVYTDNGGNIITDTTYNNVTITSTETSTTYNDCILDDCTVTDAELHITGTLTNNTFNNTLIISDGIIATDNNIFNGVGSKTYFPSHLYLTGEFTLNNNTFNLTGEWEELQYNMCIIKATSNFNPSEFINKNIFNLNITYEDEPTNTFYYNLVDDDKIRAVRL